jgi:hypothetical protein
MFVKKMKVVISNSKINSYGFRVLTEGIDLTQYRRNPVLLYGHNRYNLPVGRMENLLIEGDNLIGEPVFDEKDEYAMKIKNKWDNGFLKMASAGLDIIEISAEKKHLLVGQTRETVTRSKLVEVSIVDIGANDDALALYRDGKTLELSAGNLNLNIPEIEFKNNFNNQKEDEMKTIALKLGLPETATETEILVKIGALQLSAQNAESLQKEVEKQRERAIEVEVDAAIKLKRITGDKRDHFVGLGKTSGIEVLKTTLELMQPAVKPTDVIKSGGSNETTQTEYKTLSEVPAEKRIELRKDEPETYKKLYKAEYGLECSIEN